MDRTIARLGAPDKAEALLPGTFVVRRRQAID